MLLAALAALLVRPAACAALKAVVTLIIDDMGWHDLGFRGSMIKTPHLDTLRREGILLDNYYVIQICTPSRGALLTGRYPLALGLQGGMTVQPMQTWGLPLNETTLADVLSAQGVQAHAIGKWHLGAASFAQTPTFRGFHSFYGYYLGAEDYVEHTVGAGYDLHRDATPRCGSGCSVVDWGARGTYSAYLFAAEAAQVIASHDAARGPLYLYLAMQSVHSPVQAPAAFVRPYLPVFNSTLRATHAGMLAVLDEAVGNVTRALADAGMLNESVLLVTTDNGGPQGVACGDCNGALNFPLRGGKHSLYEGGVRGTGFVWSQALYGTAGTAGEVNRSYAGLAHITDWLPTTLTWLGLPPYAPRPGFALHGHDQSAALAAAAAGAPSPSPRSSAVLNLDPTCSGVAALRQGDWKLLLGNPGPPFGWDPPTEVAVAANDFSSPSPGPGGGGGLSLGDVCSQSWPPTPPVTRLWPLLNGTAALYNLSADPREEADEARTHPEVVAAMTAALAGWAQAAVWPVQNATADPAGAAALHNGSWVPWLP